MAGNLETANRLGLRALRVAESKGFDDLRLINVSRLGSIALERGRTQQARKYLERALQLSDIKPGSRHAGMLVVAPVVFQGPLALALAHLGNYREAIELCDAALTAAEESGHLFSKVYALMTAGNVYLQQGDFARSAKLLGQSLRLSRTIGSTLLVRQIISAMGYAFLHIGRTEEGCTLLEDAVGSTTSDPHVGQLPQHLGWLSFAKLALGKHADAIVIARRAVALARRNGQRGFEAWGWYALSRAQHALDARGSLRSLERARVIATGCGLKSLVARTDTGWGASEFEESANASAAPIPSPRVHGHLRLVESPPLKAVAPRTVVTS